MEKFINFSTLFNAINEILIRLGLLCLNDVDCYRRTKSFFFFPFFMNRRTKSLRLTMFIYLYDLKVKSEDSVEFRN